MSVNNEKLPNAIGDPLDFLSPRLREILRRLAKTDRRDEIQELVWILEAFARGRLRDQGDENVSPRILLNDLPETPQIEDVRVRRVPGRAADINAARPTRGGGA